MLQERFVVNADWRISHRGFPSHNLHPLNTEIQYINEK